MSTPRPHRAQKNTVEPSQTGVAPGHVGRVRTTREERPDVILAAHEAAVELVAPRVRRGGRASRHFKSLKRMICLVDAALDKGRTGQQAMLCQIYTIQESVAKEPEPRPELGGMGSARMGSSGVGRSHRQPKRERSAQEREETARQRGWEQVAKRVMQRVRKDQSEMKGATWEMTTRDAVGSAEGEVTLVAHAFPRVARLEARGLWLCHFPGQVRIPQSSCNPDYFFPFPVPVSSRRVSACGGRAHGRRHRASLSRLLRSAVETSFHQRVPHALTSGAAQTACRASHPDLSGDKRGRLHELLSSIVLRDLFRGAVTWGESRQEVLCGSFQHALPCGTPRCVVRVHDWLRQDVANNFNAPGRTSAEVASRFCCVYRFFFCVGNYDASAEPRRSVSLITE